MSKGSFILHLDSMDVFDELTDSQCRELINAFRNYNSGKDVNLSGLMNAIFVSFKNQFDRDNQKYEKTSLRNAKNGSLGGRPKKNPTEPKKPTGLFENPTEPKKAYNDNDNDSDNVNDKTYPFDEFWNQYDKKADRKKCELKFNKLDQGDREKIKNTIIDYVKSTPDPKYRKNPLTYLNGECWNNEITTKGGDYSHLPKHMRPDRKPMDNLTF